MTRGEWVALAIGLAVIAVLVPYGPGLWRAIAYTRELDASNTGFFYLQKRANWLPGDSLVVPDQPCHACRDREHEDCYELAPLKMGVLGIAGPENGSVELLVGFPHTCTCPDPSHDSNQ